MSPKNLQHEWFRFFDAKGVGAVDSLKKLFQWFGQTSFRQITGREVGDSVSFDKSHEVLIIHIKCVNNLTFSR